MIDLFFQQPYLNALQTTSPHLLRYLTVMVVVSYKKRRSQLKELVKILQMERYEYEDPIVDSVRALLHDCAMDTVQHQWTPIQTVLQHDYFLVALQHEFETSLRSLCVETLTRVHHALTVDHMAQRLQLSPEACMTLLKQMMAAEELPQVRLDEKEGRVYVDAEAVVDSEQALIHKVQQLMTRTHTLMEGVQSTV